MLRQLTPHFYDSEFERSATATRRGIDNTMGPQERACAVLLCQNVLEPLRAALKKAGKLPATGITVTSGFRSRALNAVVPGSSDSSDHTKGRAADIEVDGMTVVELLAFIRAQKLPFDQLIEEYAPGGWVHVGYRHGANRRQVLRKTHKTPGYTRIP